MNHVHNVGLSGNGAHYCKWAAMKVCDVLESFSFERREKMNGWRRCIVLVIFAFLSGFYAGHSNTLLSWIVPAVVMVILGFIS